MTNVNPQSDVQNSPARAAERRSPRYLLFAGASQPPRGGLGDLVATFTSEQKARDAFRNVRLQPPSPRSWAQLAVVDGDNGIKPLCWFGIGASPDGMSTETDVPPLQVSVDDGGRPRVTKRTTMLLTALVAVTITMVAVLVDGSGGPRPAVRTPGGSVVTTSSPVVPFQPPASAPSAGVVDGGSTADG
ncbi:MAG: hypothetical protein M3326_15595 [Actinomycetota bacterium]|nr:hypothetical protein [Actinomycetota bacterium]